MREDRANWMDLLIASPNQKNVVCMHVSDPGLRFSAPTGHGGKKYMCASGAQYKLHQRHSKNDTTTVLYKHFLHQYHFIEVCHRNRNLSLE